MSENTKRRFIRLEVDKFKQQQVTYFEYPRKFKQYYIYAWHNNNTSRGNNYKGFQFNFYLRQVKNKDSEVLLIDYLYQGSDWFFLRNGQMIINIDDNENLTLLPHETSTEVGIGVKNAVQEKGFYQITKDQLKKVCDSRILDIRISGNEAFHDINNKPNQKYVDKAILPADKFLFMCRAFYSEVYNVENYTEWLNKIIPEGTENQNSEGCFIATATMGSYNHPVVIDLRSFRDNWLLKRDWGRRFTQLYYAYSPKFSSLIANHKVLKLLAFILIVKPLHITVKYFR